MRRDWLIVAVALTVLMGRASLADEPAAPAWATKLPPNKWTLIDEKQSGNRLGARVVWLDDARKLVVMGGLFGGNNTKREPPRPANMIFDPAIGKWAAYTNDPALPPAAPVLRIRDAAKRLNVAVTLPEELKELACEKVSVNSPLEGSSSILRFSALVGPTVFLDPVNREVHLVGGSAPGLPGGSAGNWIYSVEKNEWRQAEFGSKDLRELRAAVEAAGRTQKDVAAAARNIFYASLPAAEETRAVRQKLVPAQAAALKLVAAAATRVEKDGARAGVAAASLKVAVRLAKESAARSQAANDGFAAGNLDAALIAAAEDAFWRLDEASAALAPEPTPRRHASGMYDPERKIYVLFGGDHGDYVLNDTWIYDCARRSWRQAWPGLAPRGRSGAQTYWLAGPRKIAILGGQVHTAGFTYYHTQQHLSAEIWVFDPGQETWAMLVSPGPEVEKKSSDNMRMFEIRNGAVMTKEGVLICPAVGGNSYPDYMVSSTWMLRLDPSSTDPALTAQAGTTGGARAYRSARVPQYDPQWYDAAPHGNPAEIDKLIAQMPANQWVAVPTAPRPCPERSWGTSLYDPDHDQIFVWSGGHCADPADIVHHFHPGINRWSIPYVAAIGVLGNHLTGRPDCANHTYHNYAFDPVSRKMVAAHRAGTHVYDPEKREWVGFTPEQFFPYNSYSAKCVGTPRGVVAWAGGCNDGGPGPIFFQIFDVKAMKWTPLAVKGKVPANVHGDEGGMTWDSKRNVLYINAAKAYGIPDGRVHRYDPATGEMTVLDPAGRDVIGDKFFTYRETVYLPEVDLVLFGIGFLNDRQAAYDPERNRWVVLNISKAATKASYDAAKGQWNFDAPVLKGSMVGSVTFAPSLDTKRNVLWAPSDYKTMYVMKLDPKTLVVSEDPAK